MTRINTRSQLVATWPPTSDVAREAGHKPQSPLQAIREKCRDCSCYQLNEIRAREAVNCAPWPFKAGEHPWQVEARKPPLTDAMIAIEHFTADAGVSINDLPDDLAAQLQDVLDEKPE